MTTYILSPETLRQWHMLTLKQRSLILLRDYQVQISPTSLGRFYRENQVKFASPQYVNSGAFFKKDLGEKRLDFCLLLSKILLSKCKIMFFDETSTHMEASLNKVWTRVDKRVHLPRTSRDSALTILGSISNFGKKFNYTIGKTTNTEAVMDFFDELEDSLTENEIAMEKYLVLDGHKSHHT